MRLGWRELVRRPSRFIAAGAMLTFIVLLLLLLGGLLDGLYDASTGAYRAQSASVIAYSETSRGSLLRSRVEEPIRRAIASIPGVERVSGLGLVLIGGRVPGRTGTLDLAVFGYEDANRRVPDPPLPGAAYADRALEAEGVRIGDEIVVGPAEVPVEVVGWVEDTRYLTQPALWVHPDTWHEILVTARPDAALPKGVFQAVLAWGGGDPSDLAARIERTVPGLVVQTIPEAVLGLPGVEAQSATFTQIISVTFVVAGVVVALFFSLVVLERVGLFGMLKALGASSRQLFSAVLTQALLVAAGAFVVGGLGSLALVRLIPEEIPVALSGRRALVTALGLLVTAAVGSAVSFRRILRIDPASAVGGA